MPEETGKMSLSEVTVLTGSWNVNGKTCEKEDLSPWLVQQVVPDIYVLGFQEFDLKRESFKEFNQELIDQWDKKIIDTLSKVGDYEQVGRQQLVGILIVIYSKKELVPFIKNLDSSMAGTGYFGSFGNKGGVAIRFQIGNDTFCFVNAHLNAHVQNFQRRNLDYQSICSRVILNPNFNLTNKPQPKQDLPEGFVISDDTGDSTNTEIPLIENIELKEGELNINDHHHVIWLGDLNYRIDLSRTETLDRINNEKWLELIEADQLKREISKGNVLTGFTEGELNFYPTYKFDPGSDNYDSSKKQRIPAYCDRVLWREDESVTILSYKGHMELKVSDHKPVSAMLKFKLKDTSSSLDNVENIDKAQSEGLEITEEKRKQDINQDDDEKNKRQKMEDVENQIEDTPKEVEKEIEEVKTEEENEIKEEEAIDEPKKEDQTQTQTQKTNIEDTPQETKEIKQEVKLPPKNLNHTSNNNGTNLQKTKPKHGAPESPGGNMMTFFILGFVVVFLAYCWAFK